MKVSLNWIKDYVKLPQDIDMSKLAYDLTMSTVEVEEVRYLSKSFENIVVGVVEDVLPHPNADKLRVCKTDIGDGKLCDIVCGGTNLEPQMKVAVALPGAKVKWHGEGDLVDIKITKLRGVESHGMICGASEIGLSDLFPSKEEGEIVDLSDFDVVPGTNLVEALGLDDVILDIDNKSLTNRPDLWGHYGMAREIAALYDLPLKSFEPFTPPEVKSLKINLKDDKRCPRYIGAKIEGVCVKPSSFEIKKRIWSAGMRPVNAIVDITNYVMLATGQPLHAFDADNIKGNITVRCAKETEKMLLLDGKELSLSGNDLVIADDDGPVALAGVMGGKNDSVLPSTNKLILEVANFEPTGIRRSVMRYETRTEAATRYEKGIDPERCDIAISLAMQMLSDTFENMSVTEFSDNYPRTSEVKKIDVSLSWLESCLGKHIGNDYIAHKLEQLGFEIKFNEDNMYIKVPSWRATGDISIPNDIIEEVARMYGLENFEPTPITTSFEGSINQLEIDLDRKIKEYLAFRCGMNEIFTYPWVNNKYISALSLNTEDMLRISSPPSPDESYIRSSLLPNLCKSVSKNLRHFNEFAIFESAQVFFNRDFESTYDSRERLPLQRRNVAGACVDGSKNLNMLFRKTKGIIESMAGHIHMESLTFGQSEKPIWADNTVWLNIVQCGKIVGNLALLSKKSALSCGIKNSSVMLFELDIDSLEPYKSRTNKFIHLSEYPMVEYDVSLTFDLSIKWENILNTIKDNSNDNLVHDVIFIDEYRGTQVPEGKKSVTFRLIIGSLERTLVSKEIETCVNNIAENLKLVLGAEYRA